MITDIAAATLRTVKQKEDAVEVARQIQYMI